MPLVDVAQNSIIIVPLIYVTFTNLFENFRRQRFEIQFICPLQEQNVRFSDGRVVGQEGISVVVFARDVVVRAFILGIPAWCNTNESRVFLDTLMGPAYVL